GEGGVCDEDDRAWTIGRKVGSEGDNIRIKWQEPSQASVDFLNEHGSDLVVLATQGRDGVAHWLHGSVAEAVFRRSAIPTLFIAPGARGFVDQVSGDVQLKRVLVPVDFSPPPGRAIADIHRFGRLLTGANVAVDLLHAGQVAPRLRVASSSALLPVILRSGNVVE